MRDRMPHNEDLAENLRQAKSAWGDILTRIDTVGRQDILKNLSVLDLGGGKGEFSKYLIEKEGIKCVSLDNNTAANPGANQVEGDAYRMPFTDGAFGMVHGQGVFDNYMYKHSFPELLTEIARVLKPKGILALHDYSRPLKAELEKKFKHLVAFDQNDYITLWEKI